MYYDSRRGYWHGREIGRNITRVARSDLFEGLTRDSKITLGGFAHHKWLKDGIARGQRGYRAVSGSKRKRSPTDNDVDGKMVETKEDLRRSKIPSKASSAAAEPEKSKRPEQDDHSDKNDEYEGDESEDHTDVDGDDGLKKLNEINIIDGDIIECLIGLRGSRQQRIHQAREAAVGGSVPSSDPYWQRRLGACRSSPRFAESERNRGAPDQDWPRTSPHW